MAEEAAGSQRYSRWTY